MLMRIGEKDNIGEDRTLFERQWAEKIQMLVILQFPHEMNRKLIELRGTYNNVWINCSVLILLILTAIRTANKISIYRLVCDNNR